MSLCEEPEMRLNVKRGTLFGTVQLKANTFAFVKESTVFRNWQSLIWWSNNHLLCASDTELLICSQKPTNWACNGADNAVHILTSLRYIWIMFLHTCSGFPSRLFLSEVFNDVMYSWWREVPPTYSFQMLIPWWQLLKSWFLYAFQRVPLLRCAVFFKRAS